MVRLVWRRLRVWGGYSFCCGGSHYAVGGSIPLDRPVVGRHSREGEGEGVSVPFYLAPRSLGMEGSCETGRRRRRERVGARMKREGRKKWRQVGGERRLWNEGE